MEPAATEQGAIERKVLYNERTYTTAARTYLALVAEAAKEEPDAAVLEAHRAKLAQDLHLFQFDLQKTERIRSSNERELQNYAASQAQVGERIAATQKDIASLREELDAARTERKHREEYDNLAQLILAMPKRSALQAEIDEQEAELAQHKTEEGRLDEAHERRSKQFRLLLHTINDLAHEVADQRAEAGAEAGAGAAPSEPAASEPPRKKQRGRKAAAAEEGELA